jgi:hypothetical protein
LITVAVDTTTPSATNAMRPVGHVVVLPRHSLARALKRTMPSPVITSWTSQ